ncbi:leucyl/phenylalanyl-tRNA--protein transferase [Palleronia abyssalis]|uniref:Leucyl/phenylalanyl-tRNA--protein transferase n=1 Tax=Palleronia abyssalis TaxID=1501240 RepID=A0A2R8BV73_9RHOB|nr:leucyl/phenylalanyl-tRNA--protein transferase [Palleronia abyssalis]SPJ24061.1 Leucyl/phenylalanyl-tRNA--protein transferase [Palleronia abyssalis]
MRAPEVTPDLVLAAYARGIFPMAEGRDSAQIFWVDPRFRGILPLQGFHVSRSLRRRMRAQPFAITFDSDFPGVLAGCADRDETWINPEIAALYLALFEAGHAHSIELWDGDILAGGVYGVTIGGAFFGESMFSRRTDASKIALAYLVDRLRHSGFTLFDTQFITPHLESLGAVEIPRSEYHLRLAQAMRTQAIFDAESPVDPADQVVQRITQTS